MGNTRDAHPLGTSPACPAATQRVAAAKLEKLFRHCQTSQHQREQALVEDLVRSTTVPGSAAEQRLREQLREPTVNFEAFVAALDTEDAFVRRLFSHIYHNVQTQALLDATVRASSSSSSSDPTATSGNAASAAESSTGTGASNASTQSSNPFMSILRRLRNRTTPLSSVLAGGVDTLPYGGSLFDPFSRNTTGGGSSSNPQDVDNDELHGNGDGYNAYGYGNDDDDESGSDDEGGRRAYRNSPWYSTNGNSPSYDSSTPSSDRYTSYYATALASASASRLVARDFTGRPIPSSSSCNYHQPLGTAPFSHLDVIIHIHLDSPAHTRLVFVFILSRDSPARHFGLPCIQPALVAVSDHATCTHTVCQCIQRVSVHVSEHYTHAVGTRHGQSVHELALQHLGRRHGAVDTIG
ncbi:hypothetical protein BCR44DRAFT_1464133 [Catenaria anguillulae PL171]|uniref:Uncharacterized protein n=1 Tax=Catenaria anguillulae PL171 TaxID=765915 RepID=A0A1Y2H954_9FUNG|nr:hypothetical protein BCR44DRAFT_1464133 [Catenaria anguillulae PL171]